ncbi:hypothetical protein F5Y16DRAFT_361871 [Xylariaceae sp. FL0255]|nr:hypothetical protein F5Y16DRAFT_361871 [Xylariaceae sp. FL0255]
MPTIHEVDEMNLIDWDAAAASTGFDLPATSQGAETNDLGPSLPPEDPSMDLVFGDIDGDDWSYWALQHYESSQLQQDLDVQQVQGLETQLAAAQQLYWEIPETPCSNCSLGGYQCKRIREGQYKGYCTSCVALRRECSFAPLTSNLTSEVDNTFPLNPWPIMGDRPETSIVLEDDLGAMMGPLPTSRPSAGILNEKPPSPRPQQMPKIGARFSRESVKILKNWLVTHSRHPYPTDEEKESLQKITGLNKTQITNWLANARRRGKIQPTRATSPHVGRGYAQAVDIPTRRGTPGLFENMNPLERWKNSPPENEPASATAIARAVSASGSYSATSGSGRTSPNVWNLSDDGSSRSLCNQSSTSSYGTSHSSGGSFASAYSNQSRGSSIPSFVRSNRGRRRRRRATPKRADDAHNPLVKTFQCTFCTESFRTKHDWQRHEKSLHLSLERWICSPDGPKIIAHANGETKCVFCGDSNPDEAHIESHNYSGCQERTLEERTFYRKDHLRQHLRLVHSVKFLASTMDKWSLASPEIRSRCGFCGCVLESWTYRTEHLAEHFRTGNTMADWKGDWGFEAPVLEMVENSIPPYLIHNERSSPLPFEASQPPTSSPTNAYELLKFELQWWIAEKKAELGHAPTDAEIQLEACRIIYGAEVILKGDGGSSSSWLCDLMMSAEEAKRQAAFNPRAPGSNELSFLKINGKSDIFENCEFERELQDYVQARRLLGLTAIDHELQDEACRIMGRMEEKSSHPSDDLANWFIRMINSSAGWLQDFRQRAHLPRSEDVGDAYKRSTDPTTIDSTIHNFSRLDFELGEYLKSQRYLGIEPTDSDLQHKARLIIYEVDDEWNQTAADDREWLSHFKERHSSNAHPTYLIPGDSTSDGMNRAATTNQAGLVNTTPSPASVTPGKSGQSPSGSSSNSIKPTASFLHDANCYRRLAKDLGRFVTATMSPNNPNRHVPTDQELQHQARWIIYEDDDPWNQTAADNAEWLQRFKVDAGILPGDSGLGLKLSEVAWDAKNGGTGFAPPYVAPNPAAQIEPLRANPQIYLRDEARPFESEVSTANHYLQTFTKRYPAPAKIFCSRELESGLAAYVKREVTKTGGVFPSDAQLRERARDIMGMQKTACDDPVLLGKFKAALQGGVAPQPAFDFGDFASPLPTIPMASTEPLLDPALAFATTADAAGLTAGTEMDLDLNFTEQELNDILQDTSYGGLVGDSSNMQQLFPELQQAQGGNASGSGSFF